MQFSDSFNIEEAKELFLPCLPTRAWNRYTRTMNEPMPTAVPPTPRSSGLAITSLVLGILSLTCFWILTGIPAVICGHIAHSRIKRSAGALRGSGLAIAGFVMGYIGIALSFLVLPMLLAIAIPNFVKARDTAMKNACVMNLRQIEGAKEQWALENKKQPGDPIVEAEVKQLLRSPVVCPAGGTYTFGPVGTLPRCSVPGHQLSGD